MDEFDKDEIKETIKKNYSSRNKYLNSLIQMFTKLTNGCILGLASKWGNGKTYFLKQLEFLLNNCLNQEYEEFISEISSLQIAKNECIKCIYINAWESEIYENPALAIIYELLLNNPSVQFGSIETGLKISNILKNIVETISKGIIKAEDIKYNTDKEMFEDLSKIKKQKELISKFIYELKGELGVNKLVIIVDELDRCKPNYSVKFLETLKHYYLVENVIVLVSIDRTQLSNSIKNVYGNEFDSYLYLDKILDILFELPSLSYDELKHYMQKKLNYELKTNYVDSIVINRAVYKFHPSLREINKFYDYYRMFIKRDSYFEKSEIIVVKYYFYPFLIFTYLFRYEKYLKFVSRDYDEAYDFLIFDRTEKIIKTDFNPKTNNDSNKNINDIKVIIKALFDVVVNVINNEKYINNECYYYEDQFSFILDDLPFLKMNLA